MEKLSKLSSDDYKIILIVFIVISIYIFLLWYKQYKWRKQWKARRDYYRNVYLKSDAWRRKRYVVLKRDNWKCVYCGERATQVHHKRYAKYNIGKEPIEWLESVCKSCHDDLH
ncbi:HNH endonuclease signature motif containing protein [Winogradskyella sp.]|uniref:HNH endonuclease n=1 Tax=Winogradskyella sp. TaxID=1883156 RepID=UPI0025D6AFAE|nr:HNH endonuclease signature motif containing protein [Winogradskyella sp.]